MKIISILITSFILAHSANASLPSWVTDKCELRAYYYLGLGMEDGPFYRVLSINSMEFEAPDGLLSVTTELMFADSDGCKKRRVQVNCRPVGPIEEQGLVVMASMTDCP